MQIARFLLSAAGLFFSLPGLLVGQVPASSLAAGDTVRYRLAVQGGGAGGAEVATFEALADSSLLVVRPSVLDTIPLAALESLEVARGTKGYAIQLAAVGAVVGCAAGVAIAGPGDDTSEPTTHRIGGCVIGLGIGIAAGIFAGGRLRHPDWVEVRLEPSGQLGLVLRIGYPGG